MERERRLGFLLDVDNTLLDNDALKEYLAALLRNTLGDEGAARFWTLYEEVRKERDVVDLPLTAQRYAARSGDGETTPEGQLQQTLNTLDSLNRLLDTLPFDRFVYPHTFETLRYLATLGAVGILSDGDLVFQRKKIERSGLAAAVAGHVLIYTHKEQHLDEVTAAQPSHHSVLIDDKARILGDVKAALGARVSTVHVLQGHYARDPLPPGFRPDITVEAIGDLRMVGPARFMPGTG